MDRAILHLMLLMIIWCCINTAGEVFIKIGAKDLPAIHSSKDFLGYLIHVLINPLVMVGIVVSALDLLLWIDILKNGDLSLVAPLSALNYLFALGAGVIFFREAISAARLIGIGLIILGVVVLARS